MEIADGAHKDERLSSYKINTVLIRWQPIWLLSEISEYINKLDNTLNGMGYLRITSRLFSKLVANFFQPPSHFSRISLLHKFLTTISFGYRNSQMCLGIIAAEINQRRTNLNNFTFFSDFFFFLPLKILLSPICKQRHYFQVMENKLSSSLWKKANFFDYWIDTIFHSFGYACY